MKRLISVLIVLALMCLLAACGAKTDFVICSNCGEDVSSEDSFCGKCGAALNNAATTSTSTYNTTRKETTAEILEKYVDISFGEFKVTDNGYYSKPSLEITVKNKCEKQCSYNITIEAVDANGARIKTEMAYANRLAPGQEVSLTAFRMANQDEIDQLKNATFRVIGILKYVH